MDSWRIQDALKHPGAVRTACQAFLPFVCSHHVRHPTAVFYINRQGGTRSSVLCAEAINIWNWCVNHWILLSAANLPGTQNVLTDLFSRHFAMDHLWERHNLVVRNIFTKLGGSGQSPVCFTGKQQIGTISGRRRRLLISKNLLLQVCGPYLVPLPSATDLPDSQWRRNWRHGQSALPFIASDGSTRQARAHVWTNGYYFRNSQTPGT